MHFVPKAKHFTQNTGVILSPVEILGLVGVGFGSVATASSPVAHAGCSQLQDNPLKMFGFKQAERGENRLSNRGSGVQISPGLPAFSGFSGEQIKPLSTWMLCFGPRAHQRG